MILRPFRYVECGSVAEAVAALAAHGDDARLIAGGTAVVPLMKHGLLRPEVLVSVARVPGLAAIEPLVDGGLRIGALATHADVARSALVRERSPLLAAACGRVASPTIRAMGTLGGNLCYGESASDPAPALLALRARLRLAGPDGEREVPVESFFTGFYETALGSGEVLMAIDVPPQPPGARTRYLKWTPRAGEDRALVGLAALLVMDGGVCREARLGLGGVARAPVALTATERSLAGARLDAAAVARAADVAAAEVEPLDDLQGSAAYRREVVRVWVRRVVDDLARRATGDRARPGTGASTGAGGGAPARPAAADLAGLAAGDFAAAQAARTTARATLDLDVNGQPAHVEAPGHWTLLQLLRDGLGLTGTKEGCGEGSCGACTVLVDGRLTRACLALAVRSGGATVLTVEGLAADGTLDPVQEAFVRHGAIQCGFCTPGLVLTVRALLAEHPHATDEEIREFLSGNFCRCGGYALILAAVQELTGRVEPCRG